MNPVQISLILDTWVNRNVSEFCNVEDTSDATPHCAHFVAHVLNLSRPGGRYLMGVPQIAQLSPNFHPLRFPDHPCTAAGSLAMPWETGLIWVTSHGGFHVNEARRCFAITESENRHVGFYDRGRVWHYENHPSDEQVVSYYLGRSPHDVVFRRFYNRYGPNCDLWLSDFPPGHWPRRFSESEVPQGVDMRLERNFPGIRFPPR